MRKTLFTIALMSIGFLGVRAFEPEMDEGVVVLGTDNFDAALAHYEHLLVEFYAPWCGHCKKLAPEYVKAAAELAAMDPPRYIAKVDATEHKELATRFDIKGFPTLNFFRNGNKSDYTGGRTADTIVSWIKKKTGPPSELKSGADLKAMQGDIKKAVVYIGALEGELFEAHQAAAATGLGDAFQFLHSADAVAADFGLDGSGVVVIRNFDEALSAYSGAATKEALTAFAEGLQTPRLVNFDEDAIDPIFGKKNPAIILFSNESGKDYQEVYRKAADDLAGKIIFVKSTTTDGIQAKLAEYVGVDAKSAPCLRIIELGEDLVKYAYDKPLAELSTESIESFIADFKAGSLKAHLKSEPIPESNDGPVKTLVGGNWQDIVGDSTKDVLVKYYAPWCGHCKSLAPIWEDLGSHVADLDDVVIAKMDSTANEVPGVAVRSYPTLIYYPKDNKAGVKYESGRDLDAFKAFLSENSSAYKAWTAGAEAGAEAAAAHDEL